MSDECRHAECDADCALNPLTGGSITTDDGEVIIVPPGCRNPTVKSFTASKNPVNCCDTVTLTWETQDGEGLAEIRGTTFGVLYVALTGTYELDTATLDTDHIVTLKVRNSCGTAEQSITFTFNDIALQYQITVEKTGDCDTNYLISWQFPNLGCNTNIIIESLTPGTWPGYNVPDGECIQGHVNIPCFPGGLGIVFHVASGCGAPTQDFPITMEGCDVSCPWLTAVDNGDCTVTVSWDTCGLGYNMESAIVEGPGFAGGGETFTSPGSRTFNVVDLCDEPGIALNGGSGGYVASWTGTLTYKIGTTICGNVAGQWQLCLPPVLIDVVLTDPTEEGEGGCYVGASSGTIEITGCFLANGVQVKDEALNTLASGGGGPDGKGSTLSFPLPELDPDTPVTVTVSPVITCANPCSTTFTFCFTGTCDPCNDGNNHSTVKVNLDGLALPDLTANPDFIADMTGYESEAPAWDGTLVLTDTCLWELPGERSLFGYGVSVTLTDTELQIVQGDGMLAGTWSVLGCSVATIEQTAGHGGTLYDYNDPDPACCLTITLL